MKKTNTILIMLIALILLADSCKNEFKNVSLQTDRDTADYYRGLWLGNYLREGRLMNKFNYDAFIKGLNTATDSEINYFEEALIEGYLDVYIQQNKQRELENEYRKYIAENKAFLEENAKKDSVISLPSGIQYVVLKKGSGDKPTTADRVSFHFSCRRIDGLLIESNYDPQPTVFGVTALPPGWKEVIQLMAEGSKWRVFIPSELAYGSEPPDDTDILPFSTLIYEIDLLEVNP